MLVNYAFEIQIVIILQILTVLRYTKVLKLEFLFFKTISIRRRSVHYLKGSGKG